MKIFFTEITWGKWKNIFLYYFKIPGQSHFLASSYYEKIMSCSYELFEQQQQCLTQPGIL